jgi:hypothetical protein
VALGSEVCNAVDVVACKDALNQLAVADVTLDEYHTTIVYQGLDVGAIACICELVENDNAAIGIAHEVLYNVAADKAGSTRNKYALKYHLVSL